MPNDTTTSPKRLFISFGIGCFVLAFICLVGGMILTSANAGAGSIAFMLLSGVWAALGLLDSITGKTLDTITRQLDATDKQSPEEP